MTETTLLIAQQLLLFIFCITLSAAFAGVRPTGRSISMMVLPAAAALMGQWALQAAFTPHTAAQLAPLLHLLLVVLLRCMTRQRLSLCTGAVLCALLCSRLPLMFSRAAAQLWPGMPLPALLACALSAALLLAAVLYFAAEPVHHVLSASTGVCLAFSAVPFFSYVFSWLAVAFPQLLPEGSGQLSSLFSAAGLFALLAMVLYGAALERHLNSEFDRLVRTTHSSQAEHELESLRAGQELARLYRHDMRHHLSMVSGYLQQAEVGRAIAYIQSTVSDIDAFTPVRYCENDAANLILSIFAHRAKTVDVTLQVEANLPREPMISETDLCALLSNALENAITATADVTDRAR